MTDTIIQTTNAVTDEPNISTDEILEGVIGLKQATDKHCPKLSKAVSILKDLSENTIDTDQNRFERAKFAEAQREAVDALSAIGKAIDVNFDEVGSQATGAKMAKTVCGIQ